MANSNVTNKENYTQMPIPYKRLNRVTLDVDEVMYDFAELRVYMNSYAHYVGQRIAVTPSSTNSEYCVIMQVNKNDKLDIVEIDGGLKSTVELHFETLNTSSGSQKALMVGYRNGSLTQKQKDNNLFILDGDPNVYSVIGLAEYVKGFTGNELEIYMRDIVNDSLSKINSDINSLRSAFNSYDRKEFFVVVYELFD